MQNNKQKTIARYTYNAFNQRTQKHVNGITTHFIYDLGGNLIQEVTQSGISQANTQSYYWLGVEPIAAANDDTLTYLHTDHLFTPRQAFDQDQSQVWAWESDAYGVTKAFLKQNTVEINLRFPGQYYDEETQLHYNWHRYYNPETGRYITSDPIGLAGGINTYAYVGGNPTNAFDLMGLVAPLTRAEVLRIPDSRVLPEEVFGKYRNLRIASGQFNPLVELITDAAVLGVFIDDFNPVTGEFIYRNRAFADFENSTPATIDPVSMLTRQQITDHQNYIFGLAIGAYFGLESVRDIIAFAAGEFFQRIKSGTGENPRDARWIREGICDARQGVHG